MKQHMVALMDNTTMLLLPFNYMWPDTRKQTLFLLSAHSVLLTYKVSAGAVKFFIRERHNMETMEHVALFLGQVFQEDTPG